MGFLAAKCMSDYDVVRGTDVVIGNTYCINIYDNIIITIWFLCQFTNGWVHEYLGSLRKTGETHHTVPSHWLFKLFTCPNYVAEIMGWVFFTLLSINSDMNINDLKYMAGCMVFTTIGAVQMSIWTKLKLKRNKNMIKNQ